MKILALDTSSRRGSVAVLEKERILANCSLDLQASEDERSLWAVDWCLKASGVKLPELDLLAVGIGPGSFTGLRIGVTTLRTIADQISKPLMGVSSLVSMVRPIALMLADPSTYLVGIRNAYQSEAYVIHGRAKDILKSVVPTDPSSKGVWSLGVKEELIAVSELENVLKARMKKLGLRSVPRILSEVPEGRQWFSKKYRDAIQDPSHFEASCHVGLLAFQAWSAGYRPPAQVLPRYLKPSSAERRLLSL